MIRGIRLLLNMLPILIDMEDTCILDWTSWPWSKLLRITCFILECKWILLLGSHFLLLAYLFNFEVFILRLRYLSWNLDRSETWGCLKSKRGCLLSWWLIPDGLRTSLRERWCWVKYDSTVIE